MAVFGETLRQARAYKGVTLKEAEQATRINRHHLAALEDENFAALPPLIYQRGIVRNYAAFLDLDPNKVLTMFEEAHGTATAAHSIPVAVKPLEMPNHFTPNFAIIAFLVVLSAIVFAWVYSAYRGPSDVLPTPTQQTTVTPLATTDAAAPVGPTTTPTLAPDGDDASPEAGGETAATADENETSRPLSDANQRRTQVAQDRNKPTATARPTQPATNVRANGSASDEPEVDAAPPTVTTAPVNTPTPDLAATQAAEEAAAAEQEAVAATQAAISESMLTISFAPSADIWLTVIGDGVVLFDGSVAAGTTVGPFDAESFQIYTSNPTSTNINNLDTGTTFYMAESSFTLP